MATSKNRNRIKRGIRSKISGTAERPRLSVYKSNTAVYAQLIDDVTGVTLVGISSAALKDIQGTKSDKSRVVGTKIAEAAIQKGITSIVFDRNGYRYHGRVKALAEGAREAGLKF